MTIDMVQHQSKTTERHLRQIADMLILNGTLTECPGLVHGKTGIAIFFFHYAQYTDNMLFADYAINLIGEIQNQIHVNSPADYEKGIAGIGVGINYLIQNNFLDADSQIFEDFDDRMYRAVMYDPWQDFSLYDGLTGYGRYWISQLRYQTTSLQARECLLRIVGLIEERYSDILDNEQSDVYCFLLDLSSNYTNLHELFGFDVGARHALSLLKQCRRELDFQPKDLTRCFSRLGDSLTGNIARIVQRNRYLNVPLQDEIDAALKQIPDLDKPPSGMGLLTGYAGEGMLRLTAINQTDLSWMKLL